MILVVYLGHGIFHPVALFFFFFLPLLRNYWGIAPCMILVKNVACHQEKKNSAAIDVIRISTRRSRLSLFHVPIFFFSKVIAQNVIGQIVVHGP